MNRTLVRKTVNSHNYNLLTLPGSNLFKFEIVNMWGSNIERVISKDSGRNVYGLSHFIEHLGFRATKDYLTTELTHALKTEGTYNASTNHDRINYWFTTTTDRAATATKLVCNYALNDLKNIPENEFKIERDIVSNESKRYMDDDQTMFYFDITPTVCALHPEDNIIGIPNTINNFSLDNAIELKEHFLRYGQQAYNITYDPLVISEDAAIDIIEQELSRFELIPSHNPIPTYQDHLAIPTIGSTFKVENESNQAMTALLFDNVDNTSAAAIGNSYLASLANNTSLNDVIREQNGLTYGISFSDETISYKQYTMFMCDVTRGTEDQLLELFVSSINSSVDAFNQQEHKVLLDQTKLQRTLAFVNQQRYMGYMWTPITNPTIMDKYEDEFAESIDLAIAAIDDQERTFDNISHYLKETQQQVNDGKFSKITN